MGSLERCQNSKNRLEQNLLHSFDFLPDEEDLITTYASCKIWLQSQTKLKQFVAVNLADIYYIPSHLLRQAALLARVYFTQRVFLETAVPEIMMCLAQPGQLASLDGLVPSHVFH